MSSENVLVSVVDDDASVRESLPPFLSAHGYDPRTFSSAEAFLASPALDRSCCLILDVAMPGMSGPDLFVELRRRSLQTPIIFITAHGNNHLCRELVDQGAAACLHKPFEPTELIAAMRLALSS